MCSADVELARRASCLLLSAPEDPSPAWPGKDLGGRVVLASVMGGSRVLTEQLHALGQGAGWLPLPGDLLVRIAGKGHREALQRVVSQDVLGLATGEGAFALLLAPKGQFQAIMAVFAGIEESWLLAPPGRGAELAARLSKFLMLSRCAAEPVLESCTLAVLGEGFADVAATAGADVAKLAHGGWHEAGGVLWFGRTLLGIPGAIAVARGAEPLAAVGERLAGVARLSDEAVQLARIRAGWPAWGAELTDTVLPPEVGIEGATISYTKGCYVGQETVARLQTYGHPNRSLVGVRQTDGSAAPPTLPAPLTAVGEEKVRGSLTSWARHPQLGGVALALVRRELADPGTVLSGAGRTFEVAPFPLW